MKLEPGKYYHHSEGRSIYIAGTVQTYRWGLSLIIEETDNSGHSISCVEADNAIDEHHRWTEIGKDEWMMRFKGKGLN